MPSLRESLKSVKEAGGRVYIPTLKPPAPYPPLPSDLEPTRNPYLSSPLPPINTSSDSLRQYYIAGKVPQFRILTAANQSISNGGTVIQNTTVSSSTNNSSSTSTGLSTGQVSVTTPVLNPNDYFETTISTPKNFQLISATSTASCRIEIYGSASARSGDLSRALDAAPSAGTTQGIILDLALDTAPYQWFFENLTGSNSDNPQASLSYITITNIDVVSNPISITLNYLVLEA